MKTRIEHEMAQKDFFSIVRYFVNYKKKTLKKC